MARVIPWDKMQVGSTYWQELYREDEIYCFMLVAKPTRARYVGWFDAYNPDGERAEIDFDTNCRYWEGLPTDEEREETPWPEC